MALSANTVFEVRVAGSGAADTNGGGFVTGSGGTDYSQQDSPQLTVSDGSCSGDTTLTSATGGFTSAMVGNILYLSSGPGWFQIAAFTDTNTVTLDRNGPSASGMTVNVGGALATPGGLGAVMAAHGVTGMLAWIKSGTYTLSTSTANVSGGVYSGPSNTVIKIEGYTTTRGDFGVPEVNCGAVGTVTVFTCPLGSDLGTSGIVCAIRAVKVDANGQSSVTAFTVSGQSVTVQLCEAVDCATGFSLSTGINAIRCTADGCTTGFTAGAGTNSTARLCRAKDCTTGFSQVVPIVCLATGGTTGFTGSSDYWTVHGCIAYGQSGDGFTAGYSSCLSYCYAENCGGYGFNTNRSSLLGCGGFNNTSGNTNTSNVKESISFTTLTATAFENAGADDFNFNNTAGGGASLRALTLPI